MKLYYTKQGERLASIAELKNVRIDELAAMNPGVDYGELRPGMKLKLPNPIARVEYPVYPQADNYYPGLDDQVQIAGESDAEIEMRGFQYHCHSGDEMKSSEKPASNKSISKRKKKVKIREIVDAEMSSADQLITPSVPWMNI